MPDDVPESVTEPEPENAPENDAEERIDALATAVIRALQPGNGLYNRCRVEELPERLDLGRVIFNAHGLSEALARLGTAGCLCGSKTVPGVPGA